MDFDTSVVLSEDAVLNVVSPLASFDFSAKVLSALPEGVKAADLGCGRILVDYSTMLQTRYVLCDIYEEDGGEDGTFRYRIVVKSGKKSGRICDALFCSFCVSGQRGNGLRTAFRCCLQFCLHWH